MDNKVAVVWVTTIISALCWVQGVNAAGQEERDEADNAQTEVDLMAPLVEQANYIFKGTVVEVNTRISEPSTEGDTGVPYTFVTYQVEREMKGSTENDTITLRFVGGPINQDEFLMVQDQPMMDLGDTDILFVSNNGDSGCPLVGCAQGRFREIDGVMFNEYGKTLEVGPEGALRLGQAAKLEDVSHHAMSETIEFYREESELEGEPYGVEHLDPLPAEQGFRPDPAGLETMIEETVQRKYTPQQLAQLLPEQSADPDKPFVDTIFAPENITAPPQELAQNESMDDEEVRERLMELFPTGNNSGEPAPVQAAKAVNASGSSLVAVANAGSLLVETESSQPVTGAERVLETHNKSPFFWWVVLALFSLAGVVVFRFFNKKVKVS